MKFTSLLLILCALLMIGCASQKLAASPIPSSTAQPTLTLTASFSYPAPLETAYYPPPVPGTPPTPYPTQPPYTSPTPTQTGTPRPTPKPLPPVQPEELYQLVRRGILRDPFSLCIQTGQPERPLFVKGFDGTQDTYHLIYRNHGKICGVAVVGYHTGIWTILTYFEFRGTNYPAIRPEDASAYIEKLTCQKTKGRPILGEEDIYNLPAWRISGVDGINYDVYSTDSPFDAYTSNFLLVHAEKQGAGMYEWLPQSRCEVNANFATPESLSTEIAFQPFPTPVYPSQKQLNQGLNILEPYDRTLPFLGQADGIYREYLGCTVRPDTAGLTVYNVPAPLSQIKKEIDAYLEKFSIGTVAWGENPRPGFPNTTWDLTGWRLPDEKDPSLLAIKISLLEIKGTAGEPVYIQTSVVISIIINDPAGYIDEDKRFTPLIKHCPGNKTWLTHNSR